MVEDLFSALFTSLSNFTVLKHHKKISFDSHSKILKKYNRHLQAGLPVSGVEFFWPVKSEHYSGCLDHFKVQ